MQLADLSLRQTTINVQLGIHLSEVGFAQNQVFSFIDSKSPASLKHIHHHHQFCTANVERDGFLYLRYLPCPFHKNVKLAGFIISWVSSYHNILVSSIFHHFLDSVWSSVRLSQILFIAWFVIFQKQAKLPLSYSLTGIWFVERSWLLAP